MGLLRFLGLSSRPEDQIRDIDRELDSLYRNLNGWQQEQRSPHRPVYSVPSSRGRQMEEQIERLERRREQLLRKLY